MPQLPGVCIPHLSFRQTLRRRVMKVTREEALRLILSHVKPVGKEVKTLHECYGRVLGENLFSPEELPNADLSAVDGFAVVSSSCRELPAELKVVETVEAGKEPVAPIGPGEAAFVMTGGIVPEGADAVVRVEDTLQKGSSVVIEKAVKPGQLINYRGSEAKKGEKILSEGELLTPRKVALIAHVGIYTVKVFRRPKVALITTGNEILEPYHSSKPGAARNTNYYLLKGLLESEGVETVYMGTVEDSPEKLKTVIEEAAENADLVVTTGGISKGKFDFVKRAVPELGFKVFFNSTNIRPGRPLLFAVKEGKTLIGLPGYPAATTVNALEFLLPAVRKLAGRSDVENRYIKATAAEKLHSREGRVDFVRVTIHQENGKITVKNAGSQQTANYTSMALCDGLAVVEAHRGEVKAGEQVEVLPLSWP